VPLKDLYLTNTNAIVFSDSVLSIFEPLIAEIEKLVAEQVNKVG